MENGKLELGKEVFELWNTADEIKSGDMYKIAKRHSVTEREVRTIYRTISRKGRRSEKTLEDNEIKRAILEATIIMEEQDFYANTEVKNITKAQAERIRKAIVTALGNRRYFSQSGSHAILNPLSDSPKYTWWGDMYWDGSGEEPLVFHTSFYKEERRIQTVEQIREIEYVLYPSGKYTFNELDVSNFKDPFKVEKMMKEEIDIRIFQEITQLELEL
ncbi:MAG: hypothetical protein ACTSQE_15725 [Candidatus Heimdallarchaeaceae archaeon]